MNQVEEDWHRKNCNGYRNWTSCIDGLPDWEYCDCEQGRELKARSDARTAYWIQQTIAILITVAIAMAVFAVAVVICGEMTK